MAKKEFIKESLEIVSELAAKTHKPGYELDLSDLESPEQAFERIYGKPTSKITPTEVLRQENPDETEKTGNHTTQEATPPNATRQSVATSCVPCSVGHFSTCSGLLNEAMRFGRREGMTNEVTDRIDKCIDELNSLERIDMTPEKMLNTPPAEKKIAEKAFAQSGALRHKLESVKDVGELEQIAADTEKYRRELGREWFKQRSSGEKEQVKKRAHELLDAELG